MQSFNLIQVLVASLAAANSVAAFQRPASSGLAMRSSALIALAAAPLAYGSPMLVERHHNGKTQAAAPAAAQKKGKGKKVLPGTTRSVAEDAEDAAYESSDKRQVVDAEDEAYELADKRQVVAEDAEDAAYEVLDKRQVDAEDEAYELSDRQVDAEDEDYELEG